MGRTSRIFVVAAAALIATAGVAMGDVLVLLDGERVAGKVTPASDAEGNRGYRVALDDGIERWVDAALVEQVLIGASDDEGAGDGASPRLASLRRSVQNTADLGAIIRKYEAFLRQADAGTPDATAAAAELETWRGRLRDGHVRLGREWVSPAERDRRLASALGRLNEARLLVKAGDLQEAARLARELADEEASAAGGEYLLGVLAVGRDDIAAARGHFRNVHEREPTHVPTLVNLAALQANFGQPQRAMWFLVEAMQTSPGNEPVLNSALEALRLLEPDERDEKNAQRALALFEQQEADLAQAKAEAGLSRWGSTWIDAQGQAAIRAERARVEERVAALKADYDAVAADAQRLDDEIRRNVQSLRQMEQASFRRDADGNYVRLPLPQTYYDIDQLVRQQTAQRQRLGRQMDALDQQAALERANLPQPPFAGKLAFIGEDGVPVTLPPEPPSTQPS